MFGKSIPLTNWVYTYWVAVVATVSLPVSSLFSNRHPATRLGGNPWVLGHIKQKKKGSRDGATLTYFGLEELLNDDKQ